MPIRSIRRFTTSSADELSNKTIASPVINTPTINTPVLADASFIGTPIEDIYAIVDAAGVEIDPANGSIQTWTLGASRTPLATNFQNGQAVVLMILDGTTYAITWTSVGVTWEGASAPTLDSALQTVIVLWKVGGVIYGKSGGTV